MLKIDMPDKLPRSLSSLPIWFPREKNKTHLINSQVPDFSPRPRLLLALDGGIGDNSGYDWCPDIFKCPSFCPSTRKGRNPSLIKKKTWASLSLKKEDRIFRERTKVQKRFLRKKKKKRRTLQLTNL